MSNSKDFINSVASIFAEKTEPRLRELLAKHGVVSPHELPIEIAKEIFTQAVIETGVSSFPNANIDALSHGFRSFLRPEFGKAITRAKALIEAESNAFAMAAGIDIAIVLAGFGLPVAPFDRKVPRILSEPTNDIDQVITSFSRWKTAFVGYSVCDLPFYIVYTDCVSTLLKRMNTDPQLADVQLLFERGGETAPQDPGVPFRHGLALFARQPGDCISTIFFRDPSPTSGSIVLLAGWRDSSGAHGAPNNGYLPVPIQYAKAAVKDPEIAFWIWRPVGRRTYIN